MASGNGMGNVLYGIGVLATFILSIMLYHALSLSFGQGAGFTVGLVLLGIIFFPILAFGNYSYVIDGKPSGNEAILDA